MAQLKAALVDALSGYGRLAMIGGERGIGKTRLAHELASHAESLDAQVNGLSTLNIFMIVNSRGSFSPKFSLALRG